MYRTVSTNKNRISVRQEIGYTILRKLQVISGMISGSKGFAHFMD